MSWFRRSDGVKFAFFCGGLALLFLWRGTVGGKVFAPLDWMFIFAPWREHADPSSLPAWDVLVWDGVAQFYVWRDLVRALWLGGEIPLWNPYQLGGMPLLANSQSAPFYLPHLLALPLPTWLAMGWLAWFHLTMAGMGLGLFLRRVGVGLAGSMVGAGLWMFSNFFISWLQMSSVPAVLCWYGWLLWGVERVRTWGGWGMGALAVPAWMMLMAGHLQFAFYGFVMAGLYAIWRVLSDSTTPYAARLRMLGWLGLSVGVAGLMALPQLVPVFELAGASHRLAVPTEAGYTAYVRNALPLFHLVTLWFPNAFGHPREGSYWGAVHYAELAMGVGAVGLLLVGMGLARRSQSMFWAGLLGMALLVALGSPLTRWLYFYLPGFSATGSPARVLCLAAVSLSVLAGLGFERRERLTQGVLLWLAGMLIGLLLAEELLPEGVSRAPLWHGIAADLATSVLPILLTVGTIGAIRRGWLSEPMGIVVLVVLAILPPFAHGYRYPLYAERDAVFPSVAILERASLAPGERVAAINTHWSLYEPPSATLPPNTATAYRIPDVGGYDSLIPRYAKQILDIINGEDSAPPENGNMQFVKQASPRLRWMRVAHLLTPEGWQPVPEAPAQWEGVYLGRAEPAPHADDLAYWQRILSEAWTDRRVLLHGAEAVPAIRQYGAGVSVPNAEIVWREVRATRVRLRILNPTSQTAWLMVSDTWDARWRARVDGVQVPLLRANLAFRALPVPPGTHEVEMICYGTDLLIGFLLSLTVATGLIGIGWCMRVRNCWTAYR